MKTLLQSKTLWFNFIMFIVFVAEQLQAVNIPWLDNDILVLVILIGNAVIRFFGTSVPLTINPSSGVKNHIMGIASLKAAAGDVNLQLNKEAPRLSFDQFCKYWPVIRAALQIVKLIVGPKKPFKFWLLSIFGIKSTLPADQNITVVDGAMNWGDSICDQQA